MDVKKEQREVHGRQVTAEELSAINAFAKAELSADEVYAFAVKLCDNEVDRDGERFSRACLSELAELFVGKTGIFDHEWSAHGQTARIYRTEIVEEKTPTAAGDRYCYLKAYAYMLKNEKNRMLIDEIEGGIKKEVSVGCSVKKSVCSICGKESGECEHERGKHYGGALCFAELQEAADAYEWSFVAVPAQRGAGVIKRFGSGESVRDIVRRYGTKKQARELDDAVKFAELGKKYLQSLRKDVVRLMLTAEESMDAQAAETVAGKLDEPELRALADAFGASVAKKLGLAPQIAPSAEKAAAEEADFCI